MVKQSLSLTSFSWANTSKSREKKARRKSKAKMVNTAIAYQFTWGCRFEGKCGIYHLCPWCNRSFIPICPIFALSKFVGDQIFNAVGHKTPKSSSLPYLLCSRRLLENLVLGKKSNQQTKTMRTKTNYKAKANDKGKENNAIFFETWPSSV